MTAIEVAGGVQIDRTAVLRTLNLNPNDPNTQALLLVCERYGLDPLLKHIVLIQGRPYVTRDGYLHLAHRSHQLDGIEIIDEGEDRDHWWARVSVYRKDMGRPFTYKGRYPKQGSGNKQYGPEMAIKCAEVAALRRAFNVTGIGAADEKWDDPSEVVDLPPAEPVVTKADADLMAACIEELEPEQRTAFLRWKADQGFTWPWTVAAYDAMQDELERIVTAAEVESAPSAEDSPAAVTSERSEPEGSGSIPETASSSAAPSGPSPDEDPGRPF